MKNRLIFSTFFEEKKIQFIYYSFLYIICKQSVYYFHILLTKKTKNLLLIFKHKIKYELNFFSHNWINFRFVFDSLLWHKAFKPKEKMFVMFINRDLVFRGFERNAMAAQTQVSALKCYTKTPQF